MKNPKHSVKKAILKKIIKGKGSKKLPFKAMSGLKKAVSDAKNIGDGGGENLGKNGIF
jgi:hypothetical protein